MSASNGNKSGNKFSNESETVAGMFANISRVYDLLNHVLSLGIDRNWRKKLVQAANPGSEGRVLDLAAGTCDVALALCKNYPGASILAIDFCKPMLEKGIKKINKSLVYGQISHCLGNGYSLPVKNKSFNSVTIAFGIRNMPNRKLVFKQIYEALKDNGKICILEFGSGKEKIWGGIYNFYLNKILPFIGMMVAQNNQAYSYLAKTIIEFPQASVLANELEEAGFKNVGWKKLTSGIVCLHWGYKL